MDWSVKPTPSLQPFLDGSWPMPQGGVGPVYSRMLFTPEEARRLFFMAVAAHPYKSKHTIFSSAGTGAQYDPNVRDTDDLGPGGPFVDEQLVEKFAAAGEQGIYELVGLRVKLRNTVPLQILGYEKDGKFVEHADSHVFNGQHWVHNTPERKFSTICWLSSYAPEPQGPMQFNGGKIVFPYFQVGQEAQLQIEPQAGQFVIFPSHPIYSHAVTPVVKGYRVALVNFWDAV